MHVGYSAIFQNPDDALSDYEVYRNELRLAELAEPLGFESIWSVEHHFTDYTMCPDVVQFLTYMAGRTERAKLGTMVVVLPWHDPMRVAEKVAMLDNISDGRVVLGIGRGLGRVEFEGFRVDMNESRQRFVEYAQYVLEGLERGYVEYDGEFVSSPAATFAPPPSAPSGAAPTRLRYRRNRPASWPGSGSASSSCRRSRGTTWNARSGNTASCTAR